jgi:hypothetical protein
VDPDPQHWLWGCTVVVTLLRLYSGRVGTREYAKVQLLLEGRRLYQGPYIYLDPRRIPPYSLAWLKADFNTLGGGKTCSFFSSYVLDIHGDVGVPDDLPHPGALSLPRPPSLLS